MMHCVASCTLAEQHDQTARGQAAARRSESSAALRCLINALPNLHPPSVTDTNV